MSASRSQRHPGCNHRQGRRRRPASSLQCRYGPDYNTYELLSTSSFASRRGSYSESGHSKQASETHAESSSSSTVKSESPPTDSSHVSKVALKLHNPVSCVAQNICSIPSTGSPTKRKTGWDAYARVMLAHKSKMPQLPARVGAIPVHITTPHLRAQLPWTSKPLGPDNIYLCSLGDRNRRTHSISVNPVLIGLCITTTTGRRSMSCTTMYGSPWQGMEITRSVWGTIILGLNTETLMWFVTVLVL